MKSLGRSYLLLFALLAGFCSCQKSVIVNTGTIKITFVNKVKGNPLVLTTQTYTNSFNESYTVSKLKYYVSNVALNGLGLSAMEDESYHLIDEARPESKSFNFESGINTFSNIEFLLGVDSIRNVSGAQTGALDPLNDMFWTWNSGYVMAKMEGNSPQSNQVGKKIEYHVGGFKGADNVLKVVNLPFPPGKLANIKVGQISEIFIEADLDTWWHTTHPVRITELPVCTTPGTAAKQISDNYSKMFKVTNVISYK
jgi:hypothetical protein